MLRSSPHLTKEATELISCTTTWFSTLLSNDYCSTATQFLVYDDPETVLRLLPFQHLGDSVTELIL